MTDSQLPDEYVLSGAGQPDPDVTGFEEPTWPRWLDVPAQGTIKRLLVVVAGESFSTPPLKISSEEHVLSMEMEVIPEEISTDGMDVRVLFCPIDGGAPLELIGFSLATPHARQRRVACDLGLSDLGGREGRFRMDCSAGNLGIPDGDWLGVGRWVVGHRERLGLLGARSHRDFRMVNELQHFPATYVGDFYARRVAPVGDSYTPTSTSSAWLGNDCHGQSNRNSQQLRLQAFVDHDELARHGEDAFGYLHRLLQKLLPCKPPDFVKRLQGLWPQRERLHILSVMSGAGRIESALTAQAGRHIDIMFVDASEPLLEQAVRSLAPGVQGRALKANVNDLTADIGTYDLVMCVSGLHHVVELEHVFGLIGTCLAPHGEFWVIGEQIGRNGNRLWREASAVANMIFKGLPAELRQNTYSGQTDSTLANTDHALSMFEGIRSQEVESLLNDYFETVESSKFNCFAWTFVDHQYRQNYRLDDPDHRLALRRIVAADLSLWLAGGRCTELHGVFKPRRLAA